MKTLLVNGNALHIPLADQSVHMVVTSPPYWGLRDYGTGGQLGLERTPDEYVANMVAVFREVFRVLRDDGTLWLNMGDSYNGSGGAGGDYNEGGLKAGQPKYPGRKVNVLKPKDLCGIPWRLAFALQADGWYLRSDIIWNKPNPMPESVTDRPTKAHEYVFLLTKRERYFWDQEAVREAQVEASFERSKYDRKVDKTNKGMPTGKDRDDNGKIFASGLNALPYTLNPSGRNIRSVWTIATQPTPEAHFATYPEALVEPCIKAGTSERGCCPKCGKQWVRMVERETPPTQPLSKVRHTPNGTHKAIGQKYNNWLNEHPSTTTGFRPDCDCVLQPGLAYPPIPAIVFDPFIGSGTTARVAQRLGRRCIGLELSPEYLEIARKRTGMTALDEWTHGKRDGAKIDDLPLFGGVYEQQHG